MHLTVISYPSALDGEIEDAVPRIDGWSATDRRQVARCQMPTELFSCVLRPGCKLRRLDLFGHGGPGALVLGDEHTPLLTADPSTWKFLEQVKVRLTEDAEVRLLGCDTGVGAEGFTVLSGLAERLGCTVWGSRTRLLWGDFHCAGFQDALVPDFLVSSRAVKGPIEGISRPGTEVEKGLRELERLGLSPPEGYIPEGYYRPAAIVDERWKDGGVQFTVCSGRRMILVTATPGRPYVLRWLASASPPTVSDLRQQLSKH